MFEKIAYESFIWSLGTTSLRPKNLNFMIECQLQLLNEFWNDPENAEVAWDRSFATPEQENIYDIKDKYYDFLVEKGYIKGNDKTKYKAARERTASLVDLGLINLNHRLTKVGEKLLDVSRSGNYESDNFLSISKDSFIYLKQLLKMTSKGGSYVVRPYIVLAYMLNKFEFLTYDEFRYLLPLCISKETTNYIVSEIENVRTNKISINEVICNVFMEKENYKKALKTFVENEVDEELIVVIGMHRKSGINGKKQYDKAYYPLYLSMYKVCVEKNYEYALNVYESTHSIKIGSDIRRYLFNTKSKKRIKDGEKSSFNSVKILEVSDENEFKEEFFRMMHLLKTRATLDDYFDLNQRYIKITDTVLFGDGKVQMDVLPNLFFKDCIDELYMSAYTECSLLEEACEIEEIHEKLIFDEAYMVSEINRQFGTTIKNSFEIKSILEDRRLTRFNELIDRRFTKEILIDLLDKFKNRDDAGIKALVTYDADVPTIFEYILGIIWYTISNREGNILEYMKLSVDADLLPISHAVGGESDIVYKYTECEDYPEHSVLLEATLMNAFAQRQNEDEPATRHLAENRLQTNNDFSYCVFSAPEMSLNLISSFRNKRTYCYFDRNDNSRYVTDLKIIPLETEELKAILEKRIEYKMLYPIFECAYRKDEAIPFWYEKCIRGELN